MDNKNSGLWQVAWAIIFATFLLTLVFATAKSNGLIVMDEHKMDVDVMMLAAATVVLTAVAILVGVGALYGYREMKEAAISAAMAHALKVAERVATERADQLVPRLIEARLQGASGPATSDSIIGAFARAIPPTETSL
jgi:hypothetical protein